MPYQKTFAFDPAHCPKIRSEFWRDVEASLHVLWGECSLGEIDVQFPVTEEKAKVLKIVVLARTISDLANCCYALGEHVSAFKAKNKNFRFYESIIPGSFELDEEKNNSRKATAKS